MGSIPLHHAVLRRHVTASSAFPHIRALCDSRCYIVAAVPAAAAANATCAANPLRLVAGAAAIALPSTAATPQNRRRCAAFPRRYGRGARPGGDDHAATRWGHLRGLWWRYYAAQLRYRGPVIFPLRRGAARGAAAGGQAGGGGNPVADLVGGGGRIMAWHALAAPTHRAATVARITGSGAVGRWPLGAGGGGADATSPCRRDQRGGAPRQCAARRGLAASGSGGGCGGGGASRPIGCRNRPRRTHVPMPLGHGARGRSRHTSHLARPWGGTGGAAARGHAAAGMPAASTEHRRRRSVPPTLPTFMT